MSFSSFSKQNSPAPRQPTLDKNAMIQAAHDFQSNPGQEINPDFLESLSCYSTLINSMSIEQIRESHPEIPTVISEVQKLPHLCTESKVTDLIADSLLSFILSESDQPAQWAAEQIRKVDPKEKKNKKFNNSKAEIISLIQQYPEQYVKTLDTKDILPLALSRPDPVILTHLVQEMETRNIEFPSELYFLIDPSFLSPKLFVKFFLSFIEAPTMAIAAQVFSGFQSRPPLHLLCMREAMKIPISKTKRAFEMIGNRMLAHLPFQFPLSFLYHPSISEFVNEVEHANGDLNNLDIDSVSFALKTIGSDSIPFLIPLLLEIPQLIDFIASFNDDFHSKIIECISFYE